MCPCLYTHRSSSWSFRCMTSITVASLTRSKSKRCGIGCCLDPTSLYPYTLSPSLYTSNLYANLLQRFSGTMRPLCLFPTCSLLSPCLPLACTLLSPFACSLPALTQLLENMITTESPDEKQAQIAKVVGMFDADNDKKVGPPHSILC